MFNLFYYSMKNIKLFSLLFVAAAMIFAGCTKEIESVEPGGGEGEGTEEGLVYKEFTVGASEVGGSKSRTVLGDRGSVLWQANDKIRVFADVDGANAEGYEFTTKEGGESATFAGMVAQADNYYALKFKQEFIDEYLPYANSIYLSVTIDTSIIEEAGYKYSGL